MSADTKTASNFTFCKFFKKANTAQQSQHFILQVIHFMGSIDLFYSSSGIIKNLEWAVNFQVIPIQKDG